MAAVSMQHLWMNSDSGTDAGEVRNRDHSRDTRFKEHLHAPHNHGRRNSGTTVNSQVGWLLTAHVSNSTETHAHRVGLTPPCAIQSASSCGWLDSYGDPYVDGLSPV
jgi:hypothetical protein